MEPLLNARPQDIRTLEQQQAERSAQSDDMGRQEFLKLLTTQLQNQNPLDPMQNEAFVAQLAQFSQLEATLSMSDSLAGFVNGERMSRLMEGAALIDRRVAIPGGQVQLGAQGGVTTMVDLPVGADGLGVRISAPSGQVVRTFQLGPQSPGSLDLGWDGKGDAGSRLPPGPYLVEATASVGGQSSPASLRNFATVAGVRSEGAGDMVTLDLAGGGSIRLDLVQRIGQ